MWTSFSYLSNAEFIQMYRHETPTPELVEELWLRLEKTIVGTATAPVLCEEDM